MNTTNTTTTNSYFYDNITVPTFTTTTNNTYSIDWNEYTKALNTLSDYFSIKDSEGIKEIIELVP